MSYSVVELGNKSFNCNDTRLALWAAFAVEEILNLENQPGWMMDLANRLVTFIERGAIFINLNDIDLNNPQIISEFSDLNLRIRRRLESLGSRLSRQQANSFKVGGTHFTADVDTEIVMKVARTIETLVTGQKSDGDIFDILAV